MKNHQFIVHHDLEINENGTKPLSSQMRFPGHAYMELKNLVDKGSKIYGFYRKGCQSDIERKKYAEDYQKEHLDEQILFSKAFLIDQDAADRIRVYTEKCHLDITELPDDDPEASYNLFFNNCVDFVNCLFKLTGLPGLYSWYLTSEEVSQIPGIIRPHVISKMAPGDKAQIVEGRSIEEIAERYNIDTQLISEKESNSMPLDMDVNLIKGFSMYSVKYFLIAPNPLLVFANSGAEMTYQDAKVLIENAKAELDAEKESHAGSLGGNAAIKNIFSNPAMLAAYQQQSMSFAMQGLSELGSTIPGLSDNILKAAMQSQAEYGDVLASMINPTKPKGQEKGDQEHVAGEDDTDWLTNLLSNTQLAMNKAYSDPDMQQFLQTLGNSSEFKFGEDA